MTQLLRPARERESFVLRWRSERWFQFRNRILSSAAFQRWAARFPIVRLIARRRASALFDLCAGFVYSQVLHAVVRLGLLEALREGPQSVSAIALQIDLSRQATRRLLDAATSLKLVERRGEDEFGLGVHGASLIGNPGVTAMVKHHALLYRDLADPIALLRGEQHATELSQFWSYAGTQSKPNDDAQVAAYSNLMASSISLITEDIFEAYPLAKHRCLLDVAGGEGAFLEAAAENAPSLSLKLFDLPPVAERARKRFERAGLSSRATAFGGDVFRDPLPEGADLISLVRVIHDHDDDEALHILRSVRRALRSGGVLMLAEPMAGTSGAEAMGAAYFGFYLMAMGQGRPRTAAQLSALILAAGFDHVHARSTRRPMLSGMLLGEVV